MKRPALVIMLFVIPLVFLLIILFCILHVVSRPEAEVEEVASSEVVYTEDDTDSSIYEPNNAEWKQYEEIDSEASNSLQPGMKYHLPVGHYAITLVGESNYSDITLYDMEATEERSMDFLAYPNRSTIDIDVTSDSLLVVTSTCVIEAIT